MRKILIALVLAVAAVGIGGFAAAKLLPEPNPLNEAVSSIQASVLDAMIDASGLKTTAQNALEANVGTIASTLGITVSEASAIVSGLDVENWTVTTLPSSATKTTVVGGSTLGVDGAVTLYDDPSYVTVEVYGRSVTFEIPESAQQYTPYLALL